MNVRSPWTGHLTKPAQECDCPCHRGRPLCMWLCVAVPSKFKRSRSPNRKNPTIRGLCSFAARRSRCQAEPPLG